MNGVCFGGNLFVFVNNILFKCDWRKKFPLRGNPICLDQEDVHICDSCIVFLFLDTQIANINSSTMLLMCTLSVSEVFFILFLESQICHIRVMIRITLCCNRKANRVGSNFLVHSKDLERS